jgi:GntR family transcriptional regulator, transcriptional repressor for pyruvate dehydrogenase complex
MGKELNRDTLAGQVAQRLTEFIRLQDLKPGDGLASADKLAAEFGVSRPVIREALKSLEGQGIIEVLNGKGAVIRPIVSTPLRVFFERAVQVDRTTTIELFEVRKGLEVECAILAAERRTPEELAQIARVVTTMRRHVHHPTTYAGLDLELHLLIAAATHNTMLCHLMESLRHALQDTIREGYRPRQTNPMQRERIQEMHEDLAAALERGDANGAARAMTIHFDEAVAALRIAYSSARSTSRPPLGHKGEEATE